MTQLQTNYLVGMPINVPWFLRVKSVKRENAKKPLGEMPGVKKPIA